MTIHTVQLDIITTMDRSDTIAITIIDHLRVIMGHLIMGHLIMGHLTNMGHLIMGHLINIDLIAISRSDHLIRRVIMGHHIMGHLTSIAHLLTEVVDKKCNEI
jgi:hypothetical protein